jgi:hypothetical protein
MSLLRTIDLAHPPLSPNVVEETLVRVLHEVHNSTAERVLKIIHGYGSRGRGGRTRDIVRNQLFLLEPRLRAVIPGEQYSLFDRRTAELRQVVGAYPDTDLDAANKGITVVWVK